MNEIIVVPRVGFLESVKNGFKNYTNFNGRIRRSEFWYFILFLSIPGIMVSILMFCTVEEKIDEEGYIYYSFPRYVQLIFLTFFLSVFSPVLSSIFRRLHDTGRKGYYFFISFVPVCGMPLLVIFLCEDSQKENNEFGASPKYLAGDESSEPINPIGINEENDGNQPDIIPEDYFNNNQQDFIPQYNEEEENNQPHNHQDIIVPRENSNNSNEKYFQIQPEIIPQK